MPEGRGFPEHLLKVMGSVVAISAIHLLRAFMNVQAVSERDLLWLVIIHLTFVVSGVLLGLMDRLTASAHQIEVEVEPQPAAQRPDLSRGA